MRLSAMFVASAIVLGSLVQPVTEAVAAPPVPEPSLFTPMAPVRVLDTRTNGSAVGPGATITLDLSGHLPEPATAVVLNITGTGPTAATFITAFPTGMPRPQTTNLSLANGETRASLTVATVNADRLVQLYNNAGSVHLIADMTGYYQRALDGGSKYRSAGPTRILDTRSTGGPLGQGATRTVDLSAKVPAGATAVTFNLTATAPTSSTFVTAWPHGTPQPGTSNLNLMTAGQTAPNLVVIAVPADRKVDLYNNAGSTHLIVDLVGYHGADADSHFMPAVPRRDLDTRTGQGTLPMQPGPVYGGGWVEWQVWRLESRWTLTSVVFSLTGFDGSASTFVGVSSDGSTSNLNLLRGQTATNLVVAPVGRTLDVYNNAGSVHLTGDVNGTFIKPNICVARDVSCVYSWGRGGQLGDGSKGLENRERPEPVPNLPGVTSMAGGSDEVLALRADGTVMVWSYSWLLNRANSTVPVPAPGLSGITAIATGFSHGLALKSDGTVVNWGLGSSGRLGNGRDYPEHEGSTVPVEVSGLTNVVSIASGIASGYAVKSDGTVWAWGDNTYGQLGNGMPCPEMCKSLVPVQVVGLTGVIAVSEEGFALKSDGTVWTWGPNFGGVLGVGDPDFNRIARTAVQIPGLTGVVQIAGSNQTRLALKSDGTVWSWGPNHKGQLGNGTIGDPVSAPVQVLQLTDVKSISTGEAYNGYALTSDGSVWSWGNNVMGQLGVPGSPNRSAVPLKIPALAGVSKISGHEFGALALIPHPR